MFNMLNLISMLKGNKGNLSSMFGGQQLGGASNNFLNTPPNAQNHSANFANGNFYSPNENQNSFLQNQNQHPSFNPNSPSQNQTQGLQKDDNNNANNSAYPYGQFPVNFTKQGQEQIKLQNKMRNQGFINPQNSAPQNQQIYPQQPTNNNPTYNNNQQNFNNSFLNNQQNTNLMSQLLPMLSNQQNAGQGALQNMLSGSSQNTETGSSQNTETASSNPLQQNPNLSNIMPLLNNLGGKGDLSALLQPMMPGQNANTGSNNELLNLLLKNLSNRNVKSASENTDKLNSKSFDLDSLKKIDE